MINTGSYHRKIQLLMRIIAITMQSILFITISLSYVNAKNKTYNDTLQLQKYHCSTSADTLNSKTEALIYHMQNSGALDFCDDNLRFFPYEDVSSKYDSICSDLENSILSSTYFSGYYIIGKNWNQYSMYNMDGIFSDPEKLYLEYSPLINDFKVNNFMLNYQKMIVFNKDDYTNIIVPEYMKSSYDEMLNSLNNKIVYYTMVDNVLCIVVYNPSFFEGIFDNFNLTNSDAAILNPSNEVIFTNSSSYEIGQKYDLDYKTYNFSYSTPLFTVALNSKFHYDFADILFNFLMFLSCLGFIMWSFKVSKKYSDKIMEPYNILNGFFYLVNKSDEVENFDYLNFPRSPNPRADISKNIFKALLSAIVIPTLLSSTMYLTAFNLMSNRFVENKLIASHNHIARQAIDNFDYYINSFCLINTENWDSYSTRAKYHVTLDENSNILNITGDIENSMFNSEFFSSVSSICKKIDKKRTLIYIPRDIYGDKAFGLVIKTPDNQMDVTVFKMDVPNISITNSDISYMLTDSENNIILQNILIDNNTKHELIEGSFNHPIYTIHYKDFNWKLYTFSDTSRLKNDIYNTISSNVYIILSLLIIILLFSWIYSTKFLTPLERLKSAMSDGGETLDSPENISNDKSNEIEEVLTVYNKMITHIKKINNEKIELMKNEEKNSVLKIQAQLNALQQQINPHFLYNTLELINLSLLKQGDFNTSKVIGSLSKIFRYSISSVDETVDLSEEIENTKNYLSIWAVRFPGRFDFEWNVDDNLLHVKTLKIILQPIMENCFFHAFNNILDCCKITIDITSDDKFILISIKDNGCGMDENTINNLKDKFNNKELNLTGKGLGICNIYKRLKLFYSDPADIEIISKLQKGTQIIIKFPII